ncbi:PepSY-like domain-containing protein [Sediminitomix flava]|uniref:Putative PepSY-like beta-lactamase-inhibitor n=1 Tax=Sediminitomix flava TaxID=379075 RepID=A0A315ZDN9_SEDFL|nr:PepSY-like domain-containing protein [Sediminitomix flava]PWJ42854.1 putative PepSY-like beta-lactamase-inhibitor [Sediminitomix flava]
MFTKISSLVLSAAMVFITMGCSDDSENNSIPNPVTPPNSLAEQTFNEMFEGATNVEWSTKNNFSVVSFKPAATNLQNSSAWFDEDGEWYMTEYETDEESLPTAVKDAFEASEWAIAPWEVDEVEKVERLGVETIYIIEVENEATDTEVEIRYSEEGVLLDSKVDSSDDDDDNNDDLLPTTLPAAIQKYIDTYHSEAIIIDRETEDDQIEIDIMEDGVNKELLFDILTNEWISTKAELTSLPTEIQEALSVQYEGYVVDDEDIDYLSTATETYYIVEIENEETDSELTLKIDVLDEEIKFTEIED